MRLHTLLFLGAMVASTVLWCPLACADATGAAPAEAANFKEILATREMLHHVEKGGYVLYMRHGKTDNAKPDRYPSVDLKDCSTQRPLSAEGVAMAGEVGANMRAAQIPIGEIRISPLCRVIDTVAAGFADRPFIVDERLMYTANLTDGEKKPIVENTRYWLSQPTEPGKNRLLIAHAPNLMDLIGYFPKEGTIVIFYPKGNDGFEYIGSIPPSHWSSLLH